MLRGRGGWRCLCHGASHPCQPFLCLHLHRDAAMAHSPCHLFPSQPASWDLAARSRCSPSQRAFEDVAFPPRSGFGLCRDGVPDSSLCWLCLGISRMLQLPCTSGTAARLLPPENQVWGQGGWSCAVCAVQEGGSCSPRGVSSQSHWCCGGESQCWRPCRDPWQLGASWPYFLALLQE